MGWVFAQDAGRFGRLQIEGAAQHQAQGRPADLAGSPEGLPAAAEQKAVDPGAPTDPGPIMAALVNGVADGIGYGVEGFLAVAQQEQGQGHQVGIQVGQTGANDLGVGRLLALEHPLQLKGWIGRLKQGVGIKIVWCRLHLQVNQI